MQKNLIALAIAGLSGAAFAQSNVTIYGVADASFESVAAGGATTTVANPASYASRTRIATNSSLIGFKGNEALGNGLTAVWQVENQVSLDGPAATTNTQSMGNGWNTRDTYVGLNGSGGTVMIGYISTPQRSTAAKYDLMPGATGSGSSLNTIGRVNVGGALAGTTALATANTFGATTAVGGSTVTNNVGTIFRSQAVAYVSPTVGGFNAAIAYVPNENRDNAAVTAAADKKNPGGWNASANYSNGPLNVSLAYLKLTDIGAIATIGAAPTILTGNEDHKNWLLGASYDFTPATKVSFMYDNYKGTLGLSAAGQAAWGAGNAEVKRNSWYLAGKHSFGASDVVLAYANVGDTKANTAGSYGDTGAKFLSLRYAFNLSKRTAVYAIYSQVTNDAKGNYDFSAIDPVLAGGTGGGNATIAAGADPRAVGVGIRHTF